MSLKLPGGSSVERQGGGDPMHHDQIEEGGLSMTLGTGGYHKASNFFQGREGGGGRECNADTDIVWEPHSLTAAPNTCTQ